MSGQNDLPVLHSLTEASLYVMLVPCTACGGAVWPRLTESAGPDEESRLTLPVTCQNCGQTGKLTFDVARVDPAEAAGGLQAWAERWQTGQMPALNPTAEPSRVIDVAGWLMLYEMLSDAGRTTGGPPDMADAGLLRRLQIQAGDCLTEALKFYDIDNDLPPEDAFFSAAHRRQFRDHPELFLRQRLTSLRLTMPMARRE